MTLLWYDLETFGRYGKFDRIAQFASIRTDENFNQLEEPIVLYGKLSMDYLPNPKACMITGITPQEVNAKGLVEADLIRQIDDRFSRPGTCVLGYNNIAFDDEFIRNLYYRNFYDPYRREWANGNSRWDLLELARATRDLRPEGINWPVNSEGKPSVQLNLLAEANGLDHDHVHDALSDVKATIAVGKLIREKQTKLYNWAWNHRTKIQLRSLINLEERTPILHTSYQNYSENGYTTLVCPIITDPILNNTIHAFDLRNNPEPLLTLPEEELRRRIFMPLEDQESNEPERIPLKPIALNKAPFLAPREVLTAETANRLGIDLALADTRWKQLKSNKQVTAKLRRILSNAPEWGSLDDPDLQIYDKFFPEEDKSKLEKIRITPPEALNTLNIQTRDSRIPEMLRRYIGRNYPHTLDSEGLHRWRSFCASRILIPPIPGSTDLGEYRKHITAWMENNELEASKKPILKALWEYGNYLEKELLTAEEKQIEEK